MTGRTVTGLKPKIVGNGFKTYDKAENNKNMVR